MMQKMKAPENCSDQVSWNGEVFEVKDGEIKVPNEAIEDLKGHGFSLLGPDSDEPPKDPPPPPPSREELINKAKELGLEFPGNISNIKLMEMIEESTKKPE